MKNCYVCKKDKLPLEFNKNASKSDGLQSICKLCCNAKNKIYYHKNVNYVKNKNMERRNRFKSLARKFIITYLKNNPCVDCGEKDIICLEFDHVRGKKVYNIGSMIGSGHTVDKIKEEILKCEVRCSNCHKKRTAKTFNWYKLSA